MAARAFQRASEQLASLWKAPHGPTLSVSGSKARVTHPFGHFIEFDVTRGDLIDLSAKLAPALEALRKGAE